MTELWHWQIPSARSLKIPLIRNVAERKKFGTFLDRKIDAVESINRPFVRDFAIPFDNNQAERDIRNVKTKVKVFGCFRTQQGAQDYLDIMSFLGTGLKHHISVFNARTAAFSGNPDIVLLS